MVVKEGIPFREAYRPRRREAQRMRRMRRLLGLLTCMTIGVAGCGQRGPLYVPDKNARVVTRSAACFGAGCQLAGTHELLGTAAPR